LFFPFFFFSLCWQHQQWRYMLNPKLYLIALLPVIAWLCFCYYVTGYWLPNTFYAKSEPMSISLSILQTSWQSFTLAGWPSTSIIWPVLVSFPVFFILFRKNKLFYTVSILSFSLVAFTIAIASSRNMLLDGYYWTRWSDPANVTLGALFCIGFCQLIFSSALTKHLQLGSAKFYNRLISLSTILVFLISIPAYIDSHHKQKFHLTMDARAIRMLNVSSGQWINKNTDKSTIIASMDAGGARYFGMRHTIDLLGLNHHQVLHSNTGFEKALSYADMLIVFPEDFSQYGLDPYFNTLTIRFFIPYRNLYKIGSF